MTISNRRVVWVVTGLFFSLVVFMGLVDWISRPLSFESSAWKQELKYRPRMVSQLLADYELKGMSFIQIEELLGKPTGRDSIHGNRYIYWAGSAGIDDRWLEVQFEDNQVVQVYYRPD